MKRRPNLLHGGVVEGLTCVRHHTAELYIFCEVQDIKWDVYPLRGQWFTPGSGCARGQGVGKAAAAVSL